MTADQIFMIYYKSVEFLSPFDIAWYWNINRYDQHISSEMTSWLNDKGFDWPMTEEQVVEFKLRFL